jgi:NAD+ diphosphatase
VISAVISSDKTKILLGKMKKMPSYFYSCLSGFIEPCESIQEAVRREVFEESGVRIGKVQVIDSQPWPIGRGGTCELMIGCIAEAITEDICIRDDEVEDVRWFSRIEALDMIESATSREGFVPSDIRTNPKPFVPGPYAIAYHLIKEALTMTLP